MTRSTLRVRTRQLFAIAVTGALFGCSTTGTIERVDTDASTSAPASTTTTSSATPLAVHGARSLEDPITPGDGNGGYDVSHYNIHLDATALADTGVITVATTIEFTVEQPLASFSLDLHGFEVTEVTVDDTAAAFERAEDDLIITPAEPLAQTHTARITTTGVPAPFTDPSSPGEIGWLTSPDGTFIVAEPNAMKSVFPCNDHPSDPATFSFTIDTVEGSTAVASGVAIGAPEPQVTSLSGTSATRWNYELTSTIPTYAVQIAIGAYDVVRSSVELADRPLELRHVVPSTMPEADRSVLALTDEQIRWMSDLIGWYPDSTYGILAADTEPSFALETSTLSMIPLRWLTSANSASVHEVTAHELAHQWFGNHVTPATWSDLWLNEGWATYVSWLWLDHAGEDTLAALVDDAVARAPMLRQRYGAVTSPDAQSLWSDNQYTGAAIVVHALRKRVGDEVFFELMRRWTRQGTLGPRSTEDFIAFANEVSGADQREFLHTWLSTTTVPPLDD